MRPTYLRPKGSKESAQNRGQEHELLPCRAESSQYEIKSKRMC